MFLAGFFTVGQFSFWGNYLPRVYPLHLRGTGESFAANIGGRLIGTSFAWLTATLAVTPDRAFAPTKVALRRRRGRLLRLSGRIHRELLACRAAERKPARLARAHLALHRMFCRRTRSAIVCKSSTSIRSSASLADDLRGVATCLQRDVWAAKSNCIACIG